MKKAAVLIFILLLQTISFSTIRFVSKTGSSTEPYTSWATAADSIQKCIDVSVFGDTIFVASGIYKEQIVMTKGLSLIGSGMDSCYIDTRDIAVPPSFYSVRMADTCLIKGFTISISGSDFGVAVGVIFYMKGCIIEENTFTDGFAGCRIVSSEAIIRKNIIKNMSSRGLTFDAPEVEYNQLIHDNLITNFEDSGIGINVGANGVIRNNIIFMNRPGNRATFMSTSYGLQKISNIIIADTAAYGLTNGLYQPMQDLNNTVVGGAKHGAIFLGAGNDARNNIVVCGGVGISVENGNPVIKYNNVWNNRVNYVNHTPDSTNMSVDPMFVDEENWDFHLQMFSPLIDAGDPSILDKDGSRSDIGAYGGPYGESYTYQDLAPKPPKNLKAQLDDRTITLNWLPNTEADFYKYRVYRDTIPDFIYDTTKIIGVISDTSFTDILWENRDLYYKITAIDSQYNQSPPSEEVTILLVGVEEPELKANDYKLYPNYPNPFNPSTMLSYRLKESGYVRLVVYDVKGELVTELINEYQSEGYYEKLFDAKAMGLSSGVYLFRIEVKNENNIPVFTDMRKSILVK